MEKVGMLRQFIHKFGIIPTTFLFTLFSVISSIFLTALAFAVVGLGQRSWSFAIGASAIIPAVVAPVMAFTILRLLAQIDKAEWERAQAMDELQEALAAAKTLSGLLPICASCKKIRDDEGYWYQVEVYVRDHSEADFSHGVCPDCGERLYGESALQKAKEKAGV